MTIGNVWDGSLEKRSQSLKTARLNSLNCEKSKYEFLFLF